MEYVERRYRSRMGRDAVVFTVSHRESDLWIAVDRGDAAVMANRVRTEEDTGSVVERACRVPEILGAMAVKGERLAVGGTFELRLFGEARDF